MISIACMYLKDVGIHIVFHREPTGMSIGTLPPFHAERSPLGIFTGNRAHSNRKVSRDKLKIMLITILYAR